MTSVYMACRHVPKKKTSGKGYHIFPAAWHRELASPGTQGCFTSVSRALQDIISKFLCCRNRPFYENSKLKLCMCAQSMGIRTKFQLEIFTVNVISGIVYFREIILESSRNVSETTPWSVTISQIQRHDIATCWLCFCYRLWLILIVKQILYIALYYPTLKIPWIRAIAVMPNLSPLSASSHPDGEGMVGVMVVLVFSAQSTVHSRYLIT